MNLFKRASFALFYTALMTASSSALFAQRLTDIKVKYSRMAITSVKFTNRTVTPRFYRHNFELELGFNHSFVGLTYVTTTKDENTPEGAEDDGFMLTGGYDFVFWKNFRLSTHARIGLSGDTNPAQPLYATDTDLHVNVISFVPQGIGALAGKPFFPSSYVGMSVNKYGKIQSLAGLGTWWNGIDFYTTLFLSLNGIENFDEPGEDVDKRFAYLKDSGVSLSASYHYAGFVFGITKNFAISNGGNDFTINVRYQHFLK